MNVSKRRLYDIVNVLEGARVLERVPGTTKTARASYEWIAPGYFSQANDEQDVLDSWMDSLRASNSSSSNASFLTPLDLLQLVEQDSTLLAISHLEHATTGSPITQYQDVEQNRFSMTLPLPESCGQESDFPQVHVFGNGSEIEPITFSSGKDKENLEIASNTTHGEHSGVRDYSPLKKLLAAIPTDGCGESSDVDDVSVQESRHPFETLLEASVLREQLQGSNTTTL